MDKSRILTIFRLITPQDLMRLAESLKHKSKHAPGSSELLVWDDSPVATEAEVLDFPKQPKKKSTISEVPASSLSQMGVLSAKEQKEKRLAEEAEAEKDKPSESDFLLEEREKFKESEERIFKQNGFACYQRSSDLSLYRVTVTDDKGKEKSRLTSTQGVLVNKKQA